MRTIKCSSLSVFGRIGLFLLFLLPSFPPLTAAFTRIKDITRIHADSEMDLLGYGLVIGLDGSGDSRGTQFTMQSLANMIERMGLTVNAEDLKVKNVAAVIVTARQSSSHKIGDRIDVTVSSVGDASSLQGGTLLMTPLASVDGNVYAYAQGPVSIGGFNVQVDDGSKIINNYTVVGRVPDGGKITSQLETAPLGNEIILTLRSPDYATAAEISRKINTKYGKTAFTEDATTIRIAIPDSLNQQNHRTEFIADVGAMEINPDQPARVVINERTGTIVVGTNVTIAPVAIAHGNIMVNIKATPVISQPEPFSRGETVVTSEYEIAVNSDTARVINLQEMVTLADIASALNQIGVAPRDIVAIFEALKQAGALRAELVII
jgi:flagellar P-ring protein precursor FlgI